MARPQGLGLGEVCGEMDVCLVALALLVHVDALVEVVLVIRIEVRFLEAGFPCDVGRESSIHVCRTLSDVHAGVRW